MFPPPEERNRASDKLTQQTCMYSLDSASYKQVCIDVIAKRIVIAK
jgi:hypothetical protein